MKKTQIVVHFQENNNVQSYILRVPSEIYLKLNVMKAKISFGLKQVVANLKPSHESIKGIDPIFEGSSFIIEELNLPKASVFI